MAVRKQHIYQPGFWFITFTCARWLPLFALTGSYDLVYNWFDHLSAQGHQVVGYVIMPNHVHLLLAYRGGTPLNTLVGNGKRFMAYELVRRLKSMNNDEVLSQLRESRTEGEVASGKLHHVFETSFDALLCYTRKFLLQKLTYIHNNPCAKKWMLAANSIEYIHSSALFYETGVKGLYPGIISFDEVDDGDWMNQME